MYKRRRYDSDDDEDEGGGRLLDVDSYAAATGNPVQADEYDVEARPGRRSSADSVNGDAKSDDERAGVEGRDRPAEGSIHTALVTNVSAKRCAAVPAFVQPEDLDIAEAIYAVLPNSLLLRAYSTPLSYLIAGKPCDALLLRQYVPSSTVHTETHHPPAKANSLGIAPRVEVGRRGPRPPGGDSAAVPKIESLNSSFSIQARVEHQSDIQQLKYRILRFDTSVHILSRHHPPLMSASSSRSDPAGDAASPAGSTSSASNLLKCSYFYSSLLATAIPGLLGKKTGITPDFDHWNFIEDKVILGALPVLTRCGDSGDHLTVLREQLRERNLQLGLVVAALEDVEMKGFGLKFVEFAQENDWRRCINPTIEYHHVAFEDTTAKVSFDAIAEAVEHMERVVDSGMAVFVHCKAGKGRSWMIVIGYLTAVRGMPFHMAEALVKEKRRQVNPSVEQKFFATEFVVKYQEWKRTRENRTFHSTSCYCFFFLFFLCFSLLFSVSLCVGGFFSVLLSMCSTTGSTSKMLTPEVNNQKQQNGKQRKKTSKQTTKNQQRVRKESKVAVLTPLSFFFHMAYHVETILLELLPPFFFLPFFSQLTMPCFIEVLIEFDTAPIPVILLGVVRNETHALIERVAEESNVEMLSVIHIGSYSSPGSMDSYNSESPCSSLWDVLRCCAVNGIKSSFWNLLRVGHLQPLVVCVDCVLLASLGSGVERRAGVKYKKKQNKNKQDGLLSMMSGYNNSLPCVLFVLCSQDEYALNGPSLPETFSYCCQKIFALVGPTGCLTYQEETGTEYVILEQIMVWFLPRAWKCSRSSSGRRTSVRGTHFLASERSTTVLGRGLIPDPPRLKNACFVKTTTTTTTEIRQTIPTIEKKKFLIFLCRRLSLYASRTVGSSTFFVWSRSVHPLLYIISFLPRASHHATPRHHHLRLIKFTRCNVSIPTK
eukprot:gene3735-2632_t